MTQQINSPQTTRTPHDSADSARQMMLYDANKKSVGVAYLLWFFLGGLGVHRFYLGRTGSACVMLALLLLGAATSWLGVGFFLLVPLGIWLLVDAFLIPGIARGHNTKLISQLA
jgi:TM2 domain-containing membrane protein YozV